MATLIYAHDPMCSWCWAFAPTWQQIESQLPAGIQAQVILGGLAPDSQEPMPEQMQQHLQGVWRQIAERVPGTRFNFDFWTSCSPRRSTWPACRAMIVAEQLQSGTGKKMSTAIQHAYYLNAQNPSDDDTLFSLADDLGLDVADFSKALHSPETRAIHQQQMALCQSLGIQGFPSLALTIDKQAQRVALDYNSAAVTIDHLESIMASAEINTAVNAANSNI